MSVPRGKTAISWGIERFWARIQKSDGCWMWTGTTNAWGYGTLIIGSRYIMAHRFSFELNVSPIPEDLSVLHHCDTPGCVRPDHLFLGTHTDNMRDMHRKGRNQDNKGEKNCLARLTEEQVRLAISLSRVFSQAEISKALGVGSSTVGSILEGRSWTHIDKSTIKFLSREEGVGFISYHNLGWHQVVEVICPGEGWHARDTVRFECGHKGRTIPGASKGICRTCRAIAKNLEVAFGMDLARE